MALAPSPFSRHEILERLRLIRTETVGPISFRQLLRQFGTVDAALEALPSLARRGGRKGPLRIPSRAEAERELSALEALGGKMIAQDGPDYPGNLAAIPDAPPLLSLIGNLHLLHHRVIAIVGARNASLAGCRIASNLAQELAQAGIIVISGLARGVDTHAHKGSIEGGTIAVMAGGVDIPYPESNTDLYKEIAQRGALISEIPLGIHPQASHFPRRNRLIAGMALGVAVIEAAAKSGSLITARLAADYVARYLQSQGHRLIHGTAVAMICSDTARPFWKALKTYCKVSLHKSPREFLNVKGAILWKYLSIPQVNKCLKRHVSRSLRLLAQHQPKLTQLFDIAFYPPLWC